MSIFTKNPVAPVHFSNFNLSHEYKTSMDMGYLVPIDCLELLPNDRVKGNTEAFIQFAPMVYPVMHRIDCKIYHFFVPNRILWKYWQKFIYDGKTDTQPVKRFIPLIGLYEVGQLRSNTLADYLGIPIQQFLARPPQGVVGSKRVDLLPFAAYQRVWNDYFRDENLQDDIWSDEEDDATKNKSLYWQFYQGQGQISSFMPVLNNLFSLRKKAWEKDYFTSALPEPQLGDPVPVSVTGNASVAAQQLDIKTNYPNSESVNTRQLMPGLKINDNSKTLSLGLYTESSDDLVRTEVSPNKVYAQLPQQTVRIDNLSFTISDLRLASAIQRMQEALARGGHRYKEAMITMYNQITPDFRLDRPEFLSASSIPVVVSAVAQTSETNTTPQAQLAGRAVAYGSNNGFSYHAQEHGFLLTLACVLPRTNYANGLSRMFTRFDRYDYHNPFFENLGDQAVKGQELYLDPASDEYNQSDWGYAPRFSEYKFKPSTVHGDFLSSLDFMTLTRFFNVAQPLNADFITVDDVTSNRAFAVQNNEQFQNAKHLYCTFYNTVKARRPMQKNPIPKLL